MGFQEKILIVNRFIECVKSGAPWPPGELKFYVTKRCNSQCIMCGNWQRNRSQIDTELSLIEIQDLAAEAKSLGIKFVTLFGGEPTLREDLPEIVAAFNKEGIAPKLITNCLRLDNNLLESLIDAGLKSLAVSLDSPDAFQNDKLRGIDGAFDAVCRVCVNVRNMVSNRRLPLTVLTVLHNRTIRSCIQFPSLLNELGVDDWILNPIIDPGNASLLGNYNTIKLNWEEIKTFCEESIPIILAQFPLSRRTHFARRLYMFSRPVGLRSNYPWPLYRDRLDYPCYLPWTVLVVRENGIVVGCNKPKTQIATIGSIRETSLAELWEGEKMSIFRLACAASPKAPFDACFRCCWGTQKRHWIIDNICKTPSLACQLDLNGFPRNPPVNWMVA